MSKGQECSSAKVLNGERTNGQTQALRVRVRHSVGVVVKDHVRDRIDCSGQGDGQGLRLGEGEWRSFGEDSHKW
jgi:hypothetical protein